MPDEVRQKPAQLTDRQKREARLAAALRANLKRRKAAARGPDKAAAAPPVAADPDDRERS